jgi:putative ABC transport system permease protein
MYRIIINRNTGMLKNYIKTTFRSLRKNKLFSIVNIFGLAIGITAAVFILQYSFFELSYDRFHTNHNDIYRVMNNRYEGEKLIQSGQITYSAVGPQMAEDYPEVLRHTTINPANEAKLRIGDKIVEAKNGFFVHQSFFEMFDFELLAGDRENLVVDLFTVVLTESTARKLFDIKDDNFDEIIEEVIFFDQDETPTIVKGVIKDSPLNSHLQFDVLASRNTLISYWSNAKFNWTSSDFYHYVQLVPKTDYKQLEAKFEGFSNKYFNGDAVTGTFEKFHLQPLNDIHLFSSGYEYEIGKTGNGKMIYSLIIIAAFILLMAWINYINLTTSRALERAREVGVRKVVGAEKRQLISQFMIETIVVNALALVIAFTMIQLLQVQFNSLVNLNLSLIDLLNSSFRGFPVLGIMGFIMCSGTLLSGLYPAFILSSYKPSQTLKGNFGGGKKGVSLRKGLVIFQFCISTILIAGTLLVSKQVSFMRDQDLGMEMDQVMVVNGPSLAGFDSTFIERINSFKNKLKQNPNVIEVGTSSNVFGDRLPRVFNATPDGGTQGYMLNRMNTDFGFMTTYGIEIVAGRGLTVTDHKVDGADVSAIIINRTASDLMGFTKPIDAVNKKIRFWGRDWFVRGVTEDFHNRSLKQTIEPIVFVPFYNINQDYYNIKLAGHNIEETVGFVEKSYNEFYQGNIFDFFFMDDRFDQQYSSDQLFGKVFNLFSILAIVISCLGLFGLAGYTVIKRTKEVGIRKVLGATEVDVLKLISGDFVKLILVASLVALPLVFFGAKEWLTEYAFQISLGAWLFLLPVVMLLMVAILTVSFHAFKSARRNPVDALRHE